MLYATCMRYLKNKQDAEDALHDVFIRAFKYLKSFNANNGSFKNWIFTITVNECLKKIKNSTSYIEISDQYEITYESDIEIRIEAKKMLAEIIALPHPYSTVVNLYLVEGYSHAEIGELLSIKAASSRSILSRAKKMLIKKIDIVNVRNS